MQTPRTTPPWARLTGGLVGLELVVIAGTCVCTLGTALIWKRLDEPAATDSLVYSCFALIVTSLLLPLPLLVRPSGRTLLAGALLVNGGVVLAWLGGYRLMDLDERCRWAIGADRVLAGDVFGFALGQLVAGVTLVVVGGRVLRRVATMPDHPVAVLPFTALFVGLAIAIGHYQVGVFRTWSGDWHVDDPEAVFLEWSRSSDEATSPQGPLASNDPDAPLPEDLSKHLLFASGSGGWAALGTVPGPLGDPLDLPEPAGDEAAVGTAQEGERFFHSEGLTLTGVQLSLELKFWPWEDHDRLIQTRVHIRRFVCPRSLDFTVVLRDGRPPGARTVLYQSRIRLRRPRPPVTDVKFTPWIQSLDVRLPGPIKLPKGDYSILVRPDRPRFLEYSRRARQETMFYAH